MRLYHNLHMMYWWRLFPASLVNADNLLVTCLSEIEDSPLKEKGIAIGKEAASAMLMKRKNDPAIGFVTYSHGTEPGVHQANYLPYAVANPPVWPANAAHIPLDGFAPFGIVSGNQFRPSAPYAINSPEYTADYNEVKKLGCTACPDRTPEQTEIGAFWKENPSGLVNRLARALAVKEKLNGWETARLQALIHMAQFDANIASFESKYFYHYWLPVTAIRAGDNDGNDNTQGDATWTPKFGPPPTPDHVSTPASALSSSGEVFKRFFGKDNISFTLPIHLIRRESKEVIPVSQRPRMKPPWQGFISDPILETPALKEKSKDERLENMYLKIIWRK